MDTPDRHAEKLAATVRRLHSPTPECPICGERFAMIWHDDLERYICHRTHDARPRVPTDPLL